MLATPQPPRSEPVVHVPPAVQYTAQPASPVMPIDPDEINLLEYIYVLVKYKWWIIGATLVGLVGGVTAAFLKGPTYVAEAVIAAKESDNGKSPNLSSFGALSGIVASQLSISANPGLDKIDLILESRKFGAEMISKYGMLPEIYKNAKPKAYTKLYDPTQRAWKPEFRQPDSLAIGALVKGRFLKKVIDTKKGTMTIKVASSDSTFSDSLLARYLSYLSLYIQNAVQKDAKENVAFLDSQLITVADPLLREKLLGLIANEVEKQMLVSKEAFKILDPPFSRVEFKQKKLFPIVFGAGLFFATVMLVVLGHAFSSGASRPEDRELVARIKRDLLKV